MIKDAANIFFWIAIASAISRVSVTIGAILISFLVGVSEYGHLGIYLAISIAATQTFGYAGYLYFLKSARPGLINKIDRSQLYEIFLLGGFSVVLFFIFAFASIDKIDISLTLFAALFVLGNTLTQCFIGTMQARGKYSEATLRAAPFVLIGSFFGIIFSLVMGGGGFLLGVAMGYIVAAITLYWYISKNGMRRKKIELSGRFLSDIIAIAASGFFLSMAVAVVISRIGSSGSLQDAGFFAFGLQIRSALVFIPGVVGAQMLTKLTTKNEYEHNFSTIRLIILSSIFSGGIVALIGAAMLVFFSLSRDFINIPAFDFFVVSAFTIGSVFIAFSTPVQRMVSVYFGEWHNAFISAATASIMIIGLFSLSASARMQSIVFACGFAIQFFIVVIYLFVFIRRRINDPAASGGVFSEEFFPLNAASGGESDPERLKNDAANS